MTKSFMSLYNIKSFPLILFIINFVRKVCKTKKLDVEKFDNNLKHTRKL